jgi:calmodulin
MGDDALREDEFEELKEDFTLLDHEGKGYFTDKDLGIVLRSIGQTPTEDELQSYVKEMDTKKCGKVSFIEFLAFMVKKIITKDSKNEIQEAFKVIEKDNSGFIPAKEFRRVLTSVGDKLSDKDIDDLFKELEVEEQGNIYWREVVDKIMSK